MFHKIVNNKSYDVNTELKNISVQTMHGVRSLMSGGDFNLQTFRDFADNLVSSLVI
jgi:hypothetical protein